MTTSADINFGDNDKAVFGASNDLQIYHDGINSYIDDAGTGSLVMRGNGAVYLQKYTGENMVAAIADGAVELYHNDALKLATSATGVTVTGTAAATAFSGSGASLTSLDAGNISSGTLAVARGGTGVTSSTGSGSNVLSTSPTLVTPVLGTPASGTLSNCTVDGTNAVGFKNIPQNSKSAAYTLVLGDSGKHILHPTADTTARTFTIPANSSVAYPVGTAITFVNQHGAGTLTIAITTDTMYLSDAGTTGSRTLAANGIATAIKVTSTEWLISGTGLT